MKRGHVMGHKKERTPTTPWWAAQEEANIRKVEAEWAAKQAAQEPPPNIDLGATFQVIDDTTTPPRWKTIGRGYATQKTARAFLKQYTLAGIWMMDDYGSRTYIRR